MSRVAKARELLPQCKKGMTLKCVSERIKRGWSDEKIIATANGASVKHDRSHPYRSPSYEQVAERKGWK